jgi:hypothetical protein
MHHLAWNMKYDKSVLQMPMNIMGHFYGSFKENSGSTSPALYIISHKNP